MRDRIGLAVWHDPSEQCQADLGEPYRARPRVTRWQRQAGRGTLATNRVKGETVTGVAGDPRRGGALVSSGGEGRGGRERWWW